MVNPKGLWKKELEKACFTGGKGYPLKPFLALFHRDFDQSERKRIFSFFASFGIWSPASLGNS